MISTKLMLRLVLVGVGMAIAFSDVPSYHGGKGKGKGKNPYNSDPCEDNVTSPPGMPYTSAPSAARIDSSSKSPSLTPTAPTIYPSASPTATKNPTKTPAPTKTPSPIILTASHSISPTTTGASSENKCTVNEEGFFGETSSNEVYVTFGYELEYEQGYDESEIISGLESSFSDFLLPLLFASQCANERRRVLTSLRRLETVGFSKRPDDVVLQDVSCTEKQDDNECVVLDGSMTIYTDDSTSIDEEKILEELKKGMENGAFVEAPIVRVSYIDLDSDPSSGEDAGTTESTPTRNTFVYGIVAVVATLFLLSLAVAWRRTHKSDSNSTLSPNITSDAVDTTAADGRI